MSSWEIVARLLRRQHGVIATWQVVAAGIHRRTFRDHVRRHHWTQLYRGVWADPASTATVQRRVWAARLTSDRGSVVTGATLLELVGVRAPRQSPRPVDLLIEPSTHRHDRSGIGWHRGLWVAGDQVEQRFGLPCAPLVRGLTDAARKSTDDRIERDIAGLHRIREAEPAEVAAYIEHRGRFPNIAGVRRALGRIDRELVHSEDERGARRVLRASGLRPHTRPLLIEVAGVRLGEVDIPFVEVRYGVEVDGPIHRLEAVALSDKTRDRRLHDQAGWIIDRFDADWIRDHPTEFVARVRAGLARAGLRAPTPWPIAASAADPVVDLGGISPQTTIGFALPRPERPAPPTPAAGGEGDAGEEGDGGEGDAGGEGDGGEGDAGEGAGALG